MAKLDNKRQGFCLLIIFDEVLFIRSYYFKSKHYFSGPASIAQVLTILAGSLLGAFYVGYPYMVPFF